MIKSFTNQLLRTVSRIKYGTMLSMSSLILLLSCQDNMGQMEVSNSLSNPTLSQQYDSESKFRALSKSFAEVLSDRKTAKELYSYTDENSGEISLNISKVVAGNYSNRTESSDSFRSALFRSLSSNKMGSEIVDELSFLVGNDIELYAPYMAETFDKDSLESLTITYFFPGMYAEFEDDPDFKGETPGFKYLFDEEGKLDLENPIEVMTNDDYAELNPTIVLLPNESIDVEFEQGKDLRPLNMQGAAINSSQPDCGDLSPTNEILTIRMPEFQLNGNIRRWPKENEMYLWISFGVLAPNSNGIPTIGVSTANPLTRYPVSRKNARKKKWVSSGISFAVQNWNYESQNLHIVWGCTRTESTLTTEAPVSVKDGQGTYSVKASKVTKNTVELVTSTIYDKCALLHNNKHQIDQGNGIRSSVPVYNFNGVRTYFTFDKYNY